MHFTERLSRFWVFKLDESWCLGLECDVNYEEPVWNIKKI